MTESQLRGPIPFRYYLRPLLGVTTVFLLLQLTAFTVGATDGDELQVPHDPRWDGLVLLITGLVLLTCARIVARTRRSWRETRVELHSDKVRITNPYRRLTITPGDVVGVREAPSGGGTVLVLPGRRSGVYVPPELENYEQVRRVVSSWRPIQPPDSRLWLVDIF